MFCSILGSSCTGFPSATQTQTYIRRELETILRIMCNLVDSHFVLISRLFGTAHVLDEYAVIYIASDFTKLHRSSQHSTSIQDHIMTLCLETGINCTSARKYERQALRLRKLLNHSSPQQLSLEQCLVGGLSQAKLSQE